ncbi:hypothetical protein Tco_0612504 [Tanacetum coccineum]
MKVIKEESEILDLLKIDNDLFSYDTPLGTIFDEFGRLNGMNDNLFTYEIGINVLSNIPCVEQQVDDSDNGDLNVYEKRACYDECENIYVEAVIFINKRLVRLIDVIVEEWLELKYEDQSTVSNEVKENVITTWLVQSYKKQFEEYMELKKQWELYGLHTDKRGDDEKLSDPEEEILNDNEIVEIFRIETVPWVANMSWLDYGPWMEPSDDIEHVCKPHRFKNGHAKWPTCN